MKHTRRNSGSRRRHRQNQKSRHLHVKINRRLRGGNDERSAIEIAEKFGLVQRTYKDISEYLDDEYQDLKDYMEDCCNFTGTLPKDSFFLGEANDGMSVVLVGKSANKELIRELEKMKQPLKIYVSNDDLVFSLIDSWDHAGDTGYTTSRSFSIESETQIGHIIYDVTFDLKGYYSEELSDEGRRVGSWEAGAGEITYRPEWRGSYEERMRKNIPTAMEAFEKRGLVEDVRGIIEEKVKSGYGRPEQFSDIRIIRSSLYLPTGEMKDILKMNVSTQNDIDEAKKRYKKDESRRKEEEEYYGSMNQPMYDSPDRGYGYGYGGYDDDYYGGRRMRHRVVKHHSRNSRRRLSRKGGKRHCGRKTRHARK